MEEWTNEDERYAVACEAKARQHHRRRMVWLSLTMLATAALVVLLTTI